MMSPGWGRGEQRTCSVSVLTERLDEATPTLSLSTSSFKQEMMRVLELNPRNTMGVLEAKQSITFHSAQTNTPCSVT